MGAEASQAAVEVVAGDVCMEGLTLVRHHLQQAHLHAEFLPGGDNADSVVSEHVLTPEEAAAEVRLNLSAAIRLLEELE